MVSESAVLGSGEGLMADGISVIVAHAEDGFQGGAKFTYSQN
jgi:hypothetical protein